MLSGWRDAAVAKRLFRKALTDPAHPQPRVINTDQSRLYDPAILAVQEQGTLQRRCRHRSVQYLGSSGKWGGGDVVGTFRIPNLLPVRLSI